MTEVEWLVADSPWPMLSHLEGESRERKLRLLACHCCRRIRHIIPAEEARRCIEVAELYAEGLASRDDLDASIRNSMEACVKLPIPRGKDVSDAINAVSRMHRSRDGGRSLCHGLAASAWATSEASRARRSDESADEFNARRERLFEEEFARQARLFREVFGNPFRPVSFSPSWRTETALILARQMYESRDFSLMRILADALQDAGCEDEQILNHCHHDGPHVRGCWVVDLVLDKE